MEGVRRSRYSMVAILLHWLIAAMLLLNIPLAWWMTGNLANPDEQARVFAAYQLHKSIGLTVLVLTLLRLLWRLFHKPPPLPAHMAKWERVAARLAHVLLYVLMLAIPLTGWIYVSAGWNSAMNIPFAIPTLWFGQFEWPHIASIASMPDAGRALTAERSMAAHEWLANGALALTALHAAAAIKHHLIDRDDVLASMLPLLRPLRSRAKNEEGQIQ